MPDMLSTTQRWLRALRLALGAEREQPTSLSARPVTSGCVVVDLALVSRWDHGASAELVVVPQAWHRRAELVEVVAATYLGTAGGDVRRVVVVIEPGDEHARRAAADARRRWERRGRRVVLTRADARD